MTINIDEQAVQSAVIAEVADRLLGDDDLYERAKRAIDDKVNALFQERAAELVETAVADAIKEGLDATYQPLDQFGRADGEPTSIRKRLGEMARDYWNTRVDKSGKPTTDSYRTMTRAEYVMIQACGDDFHKMVKQQAVNVTAELKDSLRAELKRWIDVTLDGLLRVKSADDQRAKS